MVEIHLDQSIGYVLFFQVKSWEETPATYLHFMDGLHIIVDYNARFDKDIDWGTR